MAKKTVRDISWGGKRALVRVDFNVPMEDGKITDDTRIRAAIPTIQYLLENGAAVVLMSHFGRPKKKVVETMRLAPAGARLAELLGRPVTALKTTTGAEAEAAAAALKAGDVLLLENTRFDAREEANDPEMSQELAKLGDVYVNDAFGAAHRAHASTEGVAHYLPAVSGLLLEKEIEELGSLLGNPARPYVAIMGGAKISDKVEVINNLIKVVDYLLIGGGMANTFFLAQGKNLGASLVERDAVETAKGIVAGEYASKLLLPVDLVVADKMEQGAEIKVVAPDAIPDGWRALDIGPESVKLFGEKVRGAKTVFWNGPMGYFEDDRFAEGTRGVAKAMGESQGRTVIGGGDSVAAVEQMNLADKIGHISTGGGASLELLEGKALPGVTALGDK
ncbi:phosphoglycerate kinase [Chloroflexia bacterium SDU3-3]|nr:phosphoglycerate kinase [Chloroflexia bacterium SDU3-3]